MSELRFETWEMPAARMELGQYDRAESILRDLPQMHDVREGKAGPSDL